MKKLLRNIFVLSLLFASYGSAKNLLKQSPPINYRVGLGLGGEYASIDVIVNNRPAVIFSEDGEFSSKTHHACRRLQISPSIELGTLLYDKYYFGLWFSKNYTHAQSSMKVPMTNRYNFDHELKVKSYVDLFLKTGYQTSSHIMFFCLFGPSIAHWSHQTKVFCYNKAYNVESTLNLNKSEKHFKSIGLGLGGGVEYWITKNATVNFQYILHLHPTKTIYYDSSYRQLVLDNPDYPNYEARYPKVEKKVRLTYSAIRVGVSYFFSF